MLFGAYHVYATSDENSIIIAEWFDISLCKDTSAFLLNVRLHL